MNITLQRITFNATGPTYGVLLIDNVPQAVTLELPWKENQTDVSCIPAGDYTVISHNSVEHPNTWEITNVPNRTEILIHEANTVADLLGCIGAGTSFFPGGIDQSKAAVNLLRQILKPPFQLSIINP